MLVGFPNTNQTYLDRRRRHLVIEWHRRNSVAADKRVPNQKLFLPTLYEASEVLQWLDICYIQRPKPLRTFGKQRGEHTQSDQKNVYKSCLKMISLEKWLILTPLQKLPKNEGNLGKLIVAKGI